MNLPFYDIRHEGPFTPMFSDQDVRLGIGALTLEVVKHEIGKPRKTWVREAGDSQERELTDSLAAVIYGYGNVEFSRTRGTLDVDGDEQAIIPHGIFERLTEDEQARYPKAEWKFSFDYTTPPAVHPM